MTLHEFAHASAHLEASGEAACAVHALLAVVEVGVEPLGLVALPPGHVVVREQTAGVLDGGQRQLRLVMVIHLHWETDKILTFNSGHTCTCIQPNIHNTVLSHVCNVLTVTSYMALPLSSFVPTAHSTIYTVNIYTGHICKVFKPNMQPLFTYMDAMFLQSHSASTKLLTHSTGRAELSSFFLSFIFPLPLSVYQSSFSFVWGPVRINQRLSTYILSNGAIHDIVKNLYRTYMYISMYIYIHDCTLYQTHQFTKVFDWHWLGGEGDSQVLVHDGH